MRLFLMVFILLGTACSSLPPEDRSDNRDPYETRNRSAFEFNMDLDTAILEPAAKGYRKLPQGMQTALTNHARWTSYPSTAINSVLQGKLENAALATANFLINGLTLGFFDLTKDEDKPMPEDFGQTLAAWSAPQGSYIVLPILGPGTTRSHVGLIIDSITNPLGYSGFGGTETMQYTTPAASAITFRGNNFEQINNVKYNSTDPYVTSRSYYFQFRQGQINDGTRDDNNSTDAAFDDFLNDQD